MLDPDRGVRLARDAHGALIEIPLIEARIIGAWGAWRCGGGLGSMDAAALSAEFDRMSETEWARWGLATAQHAESGDEPMLGALSYFAAADDRMSDTMGTILTAFRLLPPYEQKRYAAACIGAVRADEGWCKEHKRRWSGIDENPYPHEEPLG